MNKTISDIFERENLEQSVLIGYYGGGNFGDELLLEVLMNLFTSHNVRQLTITYQQPKNYPRYHYDFGYEKIDMADKPAIFKSILKNKNIIIGGGGLWGLDVNSNIFVLSSLLFVSRFILRKKIYMLGVGYYDSTSKLGHLSAWLAGKSADAIIARDTESLRNFRKITDRVTIDRDIAFQLIDLDLARYKDTQTPLSTLHDKTLFITLRRFKTHQHNYYTDLVEACLSKNQDIAIIISLLEPRDVDPDNFALIRRWQDTYANVQILDFSYNPVALYSFFKQNSHNLALIAPQFHAIIVAQLADIPFLPIAYDNKVAELLKATTDKPSIPINELTPEQLQAFIDTFRQANG